MNSEQTILKTDRQDSTDSYVLYAVLLLCILAAACLLQTMVGIQHRIDRAERVCGILLQSNRGLLRCHPLKLYFTKSLQVGNTSHTTELKSRST